MRDRVRSEFGDFQTPPELAARVARVLAERGVLPSSVIEPTCGLGVFVEAAVRAFPALKQILAFDINPDYVSKTRSLISIDRPQNRCEVVNFFEHDWTAGLQTASEPILVVGNPPWVTASDLGAMQSSNIPLKQNFQKHRGMDALTGKSNFDVAEWMLIKLLEAGQGLNMTLAMLVKTSVARRVLAHAWRTRLSISRTAILRFDAGQYFGVSADACMFTFSTLQGDAQECAVGELEQPDRPTGSVGWRDGSLVADTSTYDRLRIVLAEPAEPRLFRWRSGVKHDCAAVMELRRDKGKFVDAIGTRFELENDYLYPLLKGTDLFKGRVTDTTRWLIVTQAQPGADTSAIAQRAPRTWAYLCRHGVALDGRRSSIYRNRPRFSVFGVGPYTFAPWKVAISALHKRLRFSAVGPIDTRPVVFDDTCYHLSFDVPEAAIFVAELLNSEPARAILESLIFWDAKRPVTAEVLQRLNLEKVAQHLGRHEEFTQMFRGACHLIPQSSFNFGAA